MIANHWKFLHVGMIVRDVQKATEFWGQLGFSVLREPAMSLRKAEDNPQTSLIGLLRNDKVVVEVIQPLEGRFVNKTFLETVGEGVSHLSFMVEDLETEEKRMTALGFPVVYGYINFRYFDTRKVGGLMIELIQREAEGRAELA